LDFCCCIGVGVIRWRHGGDHKTICRAKNELTRKGGINEARCEVVKEYQDRLVSSTVQILIAWLSFHWAPLSRKLKVENSLIRLVFAGPAAGVVAVADSKTRLFIAIVMRFRRRRPHPGRWMIIFRPDLSSDSCLLPQGVS